MVSPKLISLFSGCGGLDLGFEKAGYDTRVAIEKELWACKTYRHNFKNTTLLGPPLHEGDVKNLSGKEIIERARLEPGEIDIVIGGPPCQSFSIAAAQRYLKSDSNFKRIGFSDKKRGTLVLEYFRLISEIAPKAFLIENVPGFKSLDGGKTIKNLRNAFGDIGYHTSKPTLLNAADYGVPQKRVRMFIIGSRNNEKITFPKPTHFKSVNLFRQHLYRTVAHALWNMPPGLENHVIRDHKKNSIQRYKKLKYGKREILGRVNRLDPREPSLTVIAGGSKGGGRSHLHPYLARTLTVRECARLQSFPDSFVFHGTIGRQFTQVGNAVPPILSYKIAHHIRTNILHSKFESESELESMYPDDVPLSELCSKLLESSKRDNAQLLYNVINFSSSDS